jgi:hypothetical protein
MGEEDILSPQYSEDEEQAAGKHEKDQNAKADTKEEREGRMNILQSHEGDIPEKKNDKEEDQTGEDQQPDENPLLGSNLQDNLPRDESMSNVKIPAFAEAASRRQAKFK